MPITTEQHAGLEKLRSSTESEWNLPGLQEIPDAGLGLSPGGASGRRRVMAAARDARARAGC